MHAPSICCERTERSSSRCIVSIVRRSASVTSLLACMRASSLMNSNKTQCVSLDVIENLRRFLIYTSFVITQHAAFEELIPGILRLKVDCLF